MLRNVKRRLMTIANQIIRKPKGFDMDTFADVEKDESEEICRTACCIAGQALVNAGARVIGDDLFIASEPLKKRINVMDADTYGWPSVRYDGTIKGCELTARNLLGLTMLEGNRLFYTHEWPKRFKDGYAKAKTPAGRARVGHNRIKHFIATNGAE